MHLVPSRTRLSYINGPTTLINFSSGIESTYCLYDFLKNSKDEIIVHHCNLINSEKRYGPELHSSRAIFDLLYTDNKNMSYVETTFDYLSFGYIIRDIEIIGFLTGTLFRNPKLSSLSTVIIPANNTDESSIPGDESVIRREAIINALLMHSQKEINFTYPAITLSKKELIERMPEHLFDLTWYCRRPLAFNKNDEPVNPLNLNTVHYWKNCFACKTCSQVNAACIELGIQNKHLNKKIYNSEYNT